MNIVPRSTWGAAPARGRVGNIGRPVGRIFLHHTVTNVSGNEHVDMRGLQRIAFSRGFADISYSFLVFPNGNVYEGRGWGKVGAHTAGYNSSSYAISLVGNYENMDMTDAQVQAARDIIRDGQRRGVLTSAVTILGHRDVKATACPGRKAYARLDEIRNLEASFTVAQVSPPRPVRNQKYPNLPDWPGNPSASGKGGYNADEHNGPGADGYVWAAQCALNRTNLYPKIDEDGFYGPQTEKAVDGFQGARKLSRDGVLGPNTWRELKKVAG